MQEIYSARGTAWDVRACRLTSSRYARFEPWPPAQADPLLNIVGQHRPERFRTNLRQPTHVKAAEIKLLLQPRVDEFRHAPALTQQGPCFWTGLTSPESAHHWILVRNNDRSPVSSIARAALATAGTDPTISLAGLVAHQPSSRPVMTVAGRQTLTFRASVRIRCWIVLELVR